MDKPPTIKTLRDWERFIDKLMEDAPGEIVIDEGTAVELFDEPDPAGRPRRLTLIEGGKTTTDPNPTENVAPAAFCEAEEKDE